MQPKNNPQRTDRDDGEAFLPDPRKGPPRSDEPVAEMIAAEYLESATSAEEQGEELRDAITADELGGPFLEVTADREFAEDDQDEETEPFPTAMRSTNQ
jgi:hypothetical protein